MDLYTKIFSQTCFNVNDVILKKYKKLKETDFKEKTHYFNGRYENIYLDINKIPELDIISSHAMKNAAHILNIKEEKLASGFWLNEMNSGDVTTAHTHDDDDELLSCVYYINVPNNSGDLIIYEKDKKINIKPEAGTFVYFSPDTLHEVSKNESGQSRLSIAFNFGIA